MSTYPRVICLDFDGCIHSYSLGFQDGTIYDNIMPGALETMNKLDRKGYTIVVLTARPNFSEVEDWIRQKFTKAGLPACPFTVTNIKPSAIAYVDDRAIRFVSWRDTLNYF